MNRPVIVSQLGPEVDALLSRHESQPIVRALSERERPWALEEPADALLVRPFAPGWREPPKERPPGWPGPLRWVMTASTGVDFFPPWLTDAPLVTCARGVSAGPIAEFALAAMLAHVKRSDATRMRSRADFKQVELTSLEGQTLGLAGFGAISQALAARALALGMKVAAFKRSAWLEPQEGVEPVASLEALAARADHLVLALPATPQTRHIVGPEVFAQAKPGLHLVNIARGILVDQEALLAALDSGRVSAASLDVTDPEPLPDGHPFYTHPAVRLTPHISWASAANKDRLTAKILENIGRFARGEPLLDVVDPARGY
jgi:phosphoglycerate dehydrogenase-like enzyme